MLKELTIKNFAIIEDLNISFNDGMSVFLGETGAGKSIIIDAFSLLLGERANNSKIRFETAPSSSDKVYLLNYSDSVTIFTGETRRTNNTDYATAVKSYDYNINNTSNPSNYGAGFWAAIESDMTVSKETRYVYYYDPSPNGGATYTYTANRSGLRPVVTLDLAKTSFVMSNDTKILANTNFNQGTQTNPTVLTSVAGSTDVKVVGVDNANNVTTFDDKFYTTNLQTEEYVTGDFKTVKASINYYKAIATHNRMSVVVTDKTTNKSLCYGTVANSITANGVLYFEFVVTKDVEYKINIITEVDSNSSTLTTTAMYLENVYVGRNGNDNNSGLEEDKPVATITKAIEIAESNNISTVSFVRALFILRDTDITTSHNLRFVCHKNNTDTYLFSDQSGRTINLGTENMKGTITFDGEGARGHHIFYCSATEALQQGKLNIYLVMEKQVLNLKKRGTIIPILTVVILYLILLVESLVKMENHLQFIQV